MLVTGASGFIGQHLVRRLIELGNRVSCLVRATSRIDELRSAGAQLVTGDVTDPASVAEGTQWWKDLTEKGGEGMVVKPLGFTMKGPRGLVP